MIDAFHNALLILSCHFNTAYLFLLCAIRMKYAYNVMFNLRTLGGECDGLYHITFLFGAFNMFECEPASEPLAATLTVYSDLAKITAKKSQRKPYFSLF